MDDGVRYVAFASAGTRGVLYAGLLDALEDHLPDYEAWRAGLRGAAGTSAGCLAALALLLGLDRAARRELLEELTDMRAVVRCPDLSLLLRHCGWEDGAAFKELVRRLLERGGLSGQSTLGDLKRLLRQDLVCVCTDLRAGAALVLSPATHPAMRVCDAVYASCCVPFVFAPARLPDGRPAVDGCLTCELPEVFEEAATLFVAPVVDEEAGEGAAAADGGDMSWGDFLHGIVRCSAVAQRPRWERLRREARCVALWVPPAAGPSFDLHLTAEACDDMRRAGYAATLDALRRGALARGVEAAVRAYARLAAVSDDDDPDDRG